MRIFLLTVSTAALLACSPSQQNGTLVKTSATKPTPSTQYDMDRQYKKFAEVPMDVDTSFLSTSEKQVVNKLIEASGYLSEIYLRQRGANYPQLREEIKSKGSATDLKMFDLHFGPCDGLEANKPFYGDTPCPKGGGFYPVDMTKDEFDAHIKANPHDKEAFTSGYTVIRRDAEGSLLAVPYHKVYAEWLLPAAKLMLEAANISENESLKNFLTLRALSLIHI